MNDVNSTPILSEEDTRKRELNKQIERVSWGLFLMMLGGLWLIPARYVPEDAWLLGAGVILIGMNLVRNRNGIPMSNFTLILGCIALVIGAANIIRFDLPVLPILMILLGAALILRPMLEKQK